MTTSPEKLGDLIRSAGRRQDPDAATLERLRASTHAAWQAELASRRRQRLVALAASLVLMVGAGFLTFHLQSSAPAIQVAHVVSGGNRVFREGEEITAPASGLTLAQLPDALTTIRMAPGARVRWQGIGRVDLMSGSLYVDTGEQEHAAPLQITAGPVAVAHVGTRFMTSRDADGVEVLVRDGIVNMVLGDERLVLERGERGLARIAGSNRNPLERGVAGSSGDEWEWVDALSPRVAVEGRDLVSVLGSLAFEAGLALRYADDRSEALAASIVLHGPAIDLPPRQALQAVLATTELQWTQTPAGKDDEIVIGMR